MNTDVLFDYIENTLLGSDLVTKARSIDHGANGVQLHGDGTVSKIALGVSCNDEFLQKAAKWEADVCIFHHGMMVNDWGVRQCRLSPYLEKQLKTAILNEMTIAGYHYSLDVHPEIGNNAVILRELGAKQLEETYYNEWGLVGEFEKAVFVQDLARKCMNLFKHDVFMVLSDNDKIKRIGVCSGGARIRVESVEEIVNKKIDLHLTGEISETNPAMAKESGFNYFSCGHYATEVFGVKALGEKIKSKFPKLEVEFIDVWNEL